MKKPLSVGIIGLGAIGSRLVEIVTREFSRELRIDYLCDLKKERLREIQKKFLPRAKALAWPTLVRRADLIIEAASQEIAQPVALKALQLDKQVLILSVGGILARDGLASILEKTAGKLWIPSGALSGIDGLLSASQGRIRSVTLVTTKPAAGLEGAPYLREKGIRLTPLKEPTVIFEGNALEAIRGFPKNVNVAATLALAGIGPEKTRVRILASPIERENRHEVEIQGDFGQIRTEIRNLPSRANPKTSELAILSVVATLKKILSRVHIGT